MRFWKRFKSHDTRRVSEEMRKHILHNLEHLKDNYQTLMEE